jgi:hypothetical protein
MRKDPPYKGIPKLFRIAVSIHADDLSRRIKQDRSRPVKVGIKRRLVLRYSNLCESTMNVRIFLRYGTLFLNYSDAQHSL